MKKLILAFLTALVCLPCAAQLLYKVSGNGLKKPSYVFGTHHLAPFRVADSVGAVKALHDVEAVAGEIDMANLDMMQMALKMQPMMMAPKDSTLQTLLGDSLFNVANEKFTAITGTPLSLFNTMKPIVAMTMLEIKPAMERFADFDQSQQMDARLQQMGDSLGKVIVGLETVEDQAQVLYNSMSIRRQADKLMETLDDPDKAVDDVMKLMDAYMKGDLPAISACVAEQSEGPDGEFMEALATRRNEKWMQRLPTLMKEHPALIVVGAGHLCGPTGLLEMLRRQGYSVKAAAPVR